jgi:hypothetical protein
MSVDLDNGYDLDLTVGRDDVEGAVGAAEANRPLPFSVTVKRLVVKSRNLARVAEPIADDECHPGLELPSDVLRNLENLVLSATGDEHLGSHHHSIPLQGVIVNGRPSGRSGEGPMGA